MTELAINLPQCNNMVHHDGKINGQNIYLRKQFTDFVHFISREETSNKTGITKK